MNVTRVSAVEIWQHEHEQKGEQSSLFSDGEFSCKCECCVSADEQKASLAAKS